MKLFRFLYFHIWNSAMNSIYMGWKFVLQCMYFGLSWVVSSSVSKVRLHKRAAAADRMELNPSARHAHPVLFWIVLVTLHIRQINLYRIKHDQWSYELVEVYCSVKAWSWTVNTHSSFITGKLKGPKIAKHNRQKKDKKRKVYDKVTSYQHQRNSV